MWSLFYTLICTVLQFLLLFEICTPVQPPSKISLGWGGRFRGHKIFLCYKLYVILGGVTKFLKKENHPFLLFLDPAGGS